MTDLLTIGRFSRLTGLSAKALRHYDAHGLLHPRAVDPTNGYRLYGAEQIQTARLIRRLRDLDVPLHVVADVLASIEANDRVKTGEVLASHLANIEGELFRHQRIAHQLRMLVHREEPITMTAELPTSATPDEHRQQAVDLFNGVWRLLESRDRTADQDLTMLHMAHASRYHWGEVGGPEHRARGEWQCARVYAVLGRSEPALFHAEACRRICEEHGIGDWDLAFAFEALARAASVAGDRGATTAALERAKQLGAEIADPEDRALLDQDLATIVVP